MLLCAVKVSRKFARTGRNRKLCSNPKAKVDLVKRLLHVTKCTVNNIVSKFLIMNALTLLILNEFLLIVQDFNKEIIFSLEQKRRIELFGTTLHVQCFSVFFI